MRSEQLQLVQVLESSAFRKSQISEGMTTVDALN